jgi:beta-galactosidase
MSVDAMQTPYVRPQENGSRIDVRWATLTDRHGSGLRCDAEPLFAFTARRWTTEDLAAARHTTDLVPGPLIWVDLDLAHHGIGSASWGQGVLARYHLLAAPMTFSVRLQAIGPHALNPPR